ncbi:Transcription factor [Quillaja saponaria]|uniref:Transcription factor n=1 Tax=Quillaja saponaria TaxID=32244 RepID=A0AAD7LIT7_QUISA|nr:Transcription factor [Quillaja saponaria]
MGEDCGTWNQLHSDWKSPNLHSLGTALDIEKKTCVSAYVNLMRNGTMPMCGSLELPHLQLGQSNEPHGWFYCLPRFRQAFMPAPNATIEEKLPAAPEKTLREDMAPTIGSLYPQKQFLVFDQSGDGTTFIFNSGFGSPIQCHTSWSPQLNDADILKDGDELFTKRDSNHLRGPNLTDDYDENQGADVQSEMHEDTEEINALLYSDDDDDDFSAEDDEVTSTGHSPSTMAAYDKDGEFFEGNTEEVASCAGKTKKRKLSDGAFDDVQLMDTASSLNPNGSFEYEDDSESRCNSGYKQCSGSGEADYSPGNKKIRKEKIRDALSILQSIIPGGKGKNPVVILDEAIHCLKSLKLKAQALGLESL